MRKALNENPLVQVAMIAMLALVVGFLLITRMGSSDSSESASETSSTATPATATEPAASASAAATDAAAIAGTPQSAVAGSGEFAAGPGLPGKVVDAYESGETVVMLILHRKGTDDRKLEQQIGSAAGAGDTAIFMVDAGEIADYSRIAEGVDVDRVPALVVIEPKSRAEGPLPTASVSYGYRGPESVAQAVRDALYKGRDDLPYYPE
jgi:hypothetical protein